MCYSKEVSLLAGAAISGFSAWSWWFYVKNKGKQISATLQAKIPYFKNAILAYLCIAGHQLFEYLAILTGSQFIYKTGLIVSMTFNYFALRSLEKISKFNFGSKLIPLYLLANWLEMLRRPMDFTNQHFYVRGYAHLPWGIAWLFLWFYFISASLFVAYHSKSPQNKKTGVLSVLLINATFILSAIYAYLATIFKFNWLNTGCLNDLFCSFDLINDFASIWCVIASLQAPFLIILFNLTR
ncbi:MAG TPA: hypothetical protein ENN77_00350, partial [Candidatus Wirthbacteria bacterium]|nr:hypothetical protein [Candidatus Wirthbacteria bacterium]